MSTHYGLIGYPLTHSFSRKFFSEKFVAESIDAEYLNFELSNIDSLPEVILNHPTLVGLNVTIPYKEMVIPYLDELDSDARTINAVNTIRISREGDKIRTKGYNTDIIGFRESIRPLLQTYHTKALILGTGGASKAVAYALKQLNMEIIFVSRNPEDKGEIGYSDLDEDTIKSFKVIVNTTPIGTFPKVNNSPSIPYELLTPKHLLYDLVYNPETTEFLRLGKMQGATIKNGLEMLHVQALASWEIWNRPE